MPASVDPPSSTSGLIETLYALCAFVVRVVPPLSSSSSAELHPPSLSNIPNNSCKASSSSPSDTPLPLLPRDTLFPHPKLPLEHLPYLLHFGTIHHYLREPFVSSDEDAPPPPPRWEGWLESWYRMIHESIWEILERDEEADRKAVAVKTSRLAQLQEEEEADAKETRHLSREIEALETRVFERMERFYVLHVVRKTYLTYQRQASNFTLSEADILARLPPGEKERFCLIEPNTVWPCNLPNSSPSPSLIVLSPCPLSTLDLYTPPDIVTPQSAEASYLMHGVNVHDVSSPGTREWTMEVFKNHPEVMRQDERGKERDRKEE